MHTKKYPNIWGKNKSSQAIRKHQTVNKIGYKHGWTVSNTQADKQKETTQQDIQAFQVLNICLNYNCKLKFSDTILSNHTVMKSLRPLSSQHVADRIRNIFQLWFILVLLFFLSLV